MFENTNFPKEWLTSEALQSSDKSGFYAALLFLVWPLLALFSAFKNYRSSWAKNILWAFVAFYGLAFAIGAESQGKDIVRSVAQVQYLHGIPMSLSDMVHYFLQSGEIDIIETIIACVVSRFTANQSVITLVYGIIFGFFFSRNMWFVLKHFKGKIRPVTILLFSCFFLVIPIWGINGFRMWTAAHIFIYGSFLYLFEEKWWGIIIASLSILVHFAFLVPVGVLVVYCLLGNRLIIYFVFFVTTFFVSQINIQTFNTVIENYAPEAVQEQTSGYRSPAQVKAYRQNSGTKNVWYAVYYRKALRWAVMGFWYFFFGKGGRFSENTNDGCACFHLRFFTLVSLI